MCRPAPSDSARQSFALSFHPLMSTLTEDEVRQRLNPERVIIALEDAFRRRYPATLMPVRTQMNLANGVFLIMPCYDREGSGLGMKLVMVSDNPTNPDQKLHATYLIIDPETGQPKHLISATYLTELRTAAVSAVATKFLAREDAKVLGIFGGRRGLTSKCFAW